MFDGNPPAYAYEKVYRVSGQTANVNACRLLKNANIQARLECLKLELSDKLQERRRKKLKKLESVWDSPEPKEGEERPQPTFGDVLRAIDIDNKMLGDYAPQKVDLSGHAEFSLEGIAVEIRPEDLEEAVKARDSRMKELRKGAQ